MPGNRASRPSHGTGVTASGRALETKEILDLILHHLDIYEIQDVVSVNRAFHWAGWDAIGRSKVYSLREISALKARKPRYAAKLASIRTVAVSRPIRCEARQKSSSYFGPSDLAALRETCPNLRTVRCGSLAAHSLIKDWRIDIAAKDIVISDVKDVDTTTRVDNDYFRRDPGRVWKDYSVSRKIKVVLRLGDTQEYPPDQWIAGIGGSLNVVSVVCNRNAYYSPSANQGTFSDTMVSLLQARRSRNSIFDEIIVMGSCSLAERTRILQACADACGVLTWYEHFWTGLALHEVPPVGTTYRVTDHLDPRAPIPITSKDIPFAIGSPTSHTAVEAYGPGPTTQAPPWTMPSLPTQYLTVLELGPTEKHNIGYRYPPPPSFLDCLIRAVRTEMPALRKLCLSLCLEDFDRSQLWPFQNYSWPGPVHDVSLTLMTGDRGKQVIPYLELARSMLCLGARPETVLVTQISHNVDADGDDYLSDDSLGHPYEHPTVLPDKVVGEVMMWLFSLTALQQHHIRMLDSVEAGLYPMPSGPVADTLRQIQFDDEARIVPISHRNFVEQYRKLRDDLNAADPVKVKQARWALSQLEECIKSN